MVNAEILRGHWHRIAGAVKEQFGEITGDDLQRVEGSVEQLVGLLQSKAGQTREQVEEFLNACCRDAEESYRQAVQRASRWADQAGDYLRDGYGGLSEGAARSYGYARSTVQRRPVESAAVIAGVGVLVGLVIGLSLGNRR